MNTPLCGDRFINPIGVASRLRWLSWLDRQSVASFCPFTRLNVNGLLCLRSLCDTAFLPGFVSV